MDRPYYPTCSSFKYEVDSRSGDVMDMRGDGVGEDAGGTSPPFQHLGQDMHTKSILALQELQNEVGALLEFRDVVIETFPQLRGKLRSQLGGSSSSGGSTGVGGTGRWEPGIRVGRKPKEEPPRSRSNSRSKSCSVVAVQDSGFCTAESSGSKKTMEEEDVDELWCLMELIQTKGNKLKKEVESLKDSCSPTHHRSRSLSELESPQDKEEIHRLIQEKQMLLDRVTEMETENIARAEESSRLSKRISDLLQEKTRLENALGNTDHSSPPPTTLGRLDAVLSSSPGDYISCPAGLTPDRNVTAAILKEKNVFELQRHLITTTHQKQVVERRLEKLAKMKATLVQQLEKYKEENEDLRFQLEEKSIELEGTRARVRLLERQTPPCANIEPSTATNPSATSVESSDHTTAEDNSSTESAHGIMSRRKHKPSRIPLKARALPSAPPNSLNKGRVLSPNTSSISGTQRTSSPVQAKPGQVQVARDVGRGNNNNGNEGKVLYNKFAAIGNWLKISSPSP